jgi:hypothetical protein
MRAKHLSRLAAEIVVAMPLAACTGATAEAPTPRVEGTIQVCEDGCAFSELAPALEAAKDGDTVSLADGSYDGGVIIDASITLRGSGISRTTIAGGGPVIQVGSFGVSTSLVVTIEDLTITGGVTRTTQEADEAGLPGAEARGGGLMIPAGRDQGLGAAVTVRNVAITHNRVAPTDGEEFSGDEGVIVSSVASGGGIDSWGDLTLDHSVVTDNRVGAATNLTLPGMASDAYGGGIMHHQGDLKIVDSEIRGNAASAAPPNGRYAQGGGLFVERGTLTVTDTVIADNRAVLESAFPSTVEASAEPGGVLVHGGVSRATFERTEITGNAAMMTSRVADADANTGGLKVVPGVNLTVDASTISDNSVTARAIGSHGDAVAGIGGGSLVGTVTNTVFEGNVANASSKGGDASAAVGGVTLDGTLEDCSISGNMVHAEALHGTVTAFAGGVWVAEEPITVRGSEIRDNLVTAKGSAGTARGGGIYDGPNAGGWGPSDLTLVDTLITRNVLRASRQIVLKGGGLYLEGARLRLQHSTIEGNKPHDCVGCP